MNDIRTSNSVTTTQPSSVSSKERLLALTLDMFECAKAGDWEQLANLEQGRLPLFNEVFSAGISGNEALAREILSVDEKTVELAEARVPTLQRELLSMRNSGKANNAYQAVQRCLSDDE